MNGKEKKGKAESANEEENGKKTDRGGKRIGVRWKVTTTKRILEEFEGEEKERNSSL